MAKLYGVEMKFVEKMTSAGKGFLSVFFKGANLSDEGNQVLNHPWLFGGRNFLGGGNLISQKWSLRIRLH